MSRTEQRRDDTGGPQDAARYYADPYRCRRWITCRNCERYRLTREALTNDELVQLVDLTYVPCHHCGGRMVEA